MIQTHNLTFEYPGGQQFKFPDIHCEENEMMLVLGNSGVGKTTLLHLLGGLLTATTGGIKIQHKDITKIFGAELDLFRGQHIGIIFQNNHFVHAINVLDNLMLAQSLAGAHRDKQKCLQLLERLNIGHKAKSKISMLSQGERQRVAIARSLVNNPSLILADEPTSALDDLNSNEVLKLLEEQSKKIGSALIIVTHDNRLKDKIDKKVILS
jgi:putative ABC transport system ATP-binding protein